ncbi:MAG: hypothetical protein KC996_06125 [Phycisphaerales bacterium]|nr:hypothetical protein [Phycisphaerales bacterium]
MVAVYIILGLIAAALFVTFVVRAAIAAEERRKLRIEEMRSFAHGLGLDFTEQQDPYHDEHYAHFELFRQGFDRNAYNTAWGEIVHNGRTFGINCGDFTYKTRETYTTTDSKGRTQTRTRIVTHHFSYFILELNIRNIPDLLIRREGLFDRIASAFGKDDIDFESAEFSRRYFVKCDDRKFAYDLIHPRMMEFMLQTRPGLVDMENSRICLSGGYSTWPASQFAQTLDWLQRFIDHWPAFVFKDLERADHTSSPQPDRIR